MKVNEWYFKNTLKFKKPINVMSNNLRKSKYWDPLGNFLIFVYIIDIFKNCVKMFINHWICILYIKFWLPAGDESGKWCKINKSWKNTLWKILKLTLKNCWISRWRYFRCSCWFEPLIKTIIYYSLKNHQKWINKSMNNFIHPNCYNFRI